MTTPSAPDGAPAADAGSDAPIRLHSGRELAFHGTGARHPALFGERFTPYRDLTHVALSPAGLRIASRGSSYWIRRRDFRSSEDMITAAQRLRARVAREPDGGAQLARMDALDERMRRAPVPLLGRLLAWTCWLLFGVQLFAPGFQDLTVFSAPWVQVGDWWRLVTSQFLHAGLLHLGLNTLCIWVLTELLERIVGRGRTVAVLLVAGLGSGLACWWAQYVEALGISGILTGVIGALLALEFLRPEHLPAPWRIPRTLFVGVLAAEAVLLSGFDSIAHAAHAGGFVAGAIAGVLVAPRSSESLRETGVWRMVPMTAVAVVVLSFVPPLRVWIDPEGSFEARAERLLAIEDVEAPALNNHAWVIAISEAPSPAALDVALRLAERAVALTGRGDANLLDTLAEVHFARGDAGRAVDTIDEAIELSDDRYFHEQRRRYTGERAADDRPDPPQPVGPRPLPQRRPAEPDPPPGSIRV